MEIFVALFFLWLIVTLVGHGSWVVIRALFSAISDQPAAPYPQANPQQQDIFASHRVVNRMLHEGLIDQQQAEELHRQLRTLQYGESVAPLKSDHDLAANLPSPGQTEPATPAEPIALAETRNLDDVSTEPIVATLYQDRDVAAAAPVAATPAPADADVADTPVITAQTAPVPPIPAAPVLSKAELIQSFLAAHNIRWGELVAGILIVVCSIGLVISLWSPLVETHPVIPSLIFLGTNAAIYAAGLYTLARWRLRHTSRAVLVIATLLVPLSVLAGLAAAGTGAESVQLNDPVTLAAIFVAGLIYIALLLYGGRALTGPYARQVALSVAGPVTVLPLMPAVVRTWGANAGWSIGLGSAAVIVALTWMIKLRRRQDLPLGVVGSRSRLLVMSVGGFALAVSIGYASFAVREYGNLAILPIAIAAIPALVGLAAAGRSLMISAGSATQSLIGAVTCILLVGLCWAILPPAMIEAHWMWTWAIVLSASGIAVGWLLKQPRWLPVSTLPLGLATMVSSPVWLGDSLWDSIPLWKRVIGGEPMLAATMVAVIVAAVTVLMRNPDRRRWMGYAAAFWIGVAISSAGVLAVGPESLLASAPWWTVTAVLFSGAVASVFLASRTKIWSFATIVATTLAWCSVYRPIQWLDSAPLQSSDVWMITALSIAATLIALRELAPRLKPLSNAVTFSSASIWETASVAYSVFAAAIACVFVTRDWSTSALVLAGATGLLFWASTASRSIILLRVAQLASVALAMVVAHGQYGEQLFEMTAWKRGVAPWSWATVAAAVTAFWLAIRELSRVDFSICRRRFRFMTTSPAVPGEMIDGWTAIVTATLAAFGAGWTFATLLFAASDQQGITNEAGFILPMAAIAMGTAVTLWMRQHEKDRQPRLSGDLAVTVMLSTLLWIASQPTTLLGVDAIAQLIIATTLVVVGCIVIRLYGSKIRVVADAKKAIELPTVVAALAIMLASAVLLTFGWYEPIRDQLRAHALPTLSVAAWWLIAAVVLMIVAKRDHHSSLAIGSAIITPAAIALVVPVFSVTHPVIWIQCAAIASIVWSEACRYFYGDEESTFWPSISGSLWWASVAGVATAATVTVRVLFDVPALNVVFGPAGAILSLATVLLLCWGRMSMSSTVSSEKQFVLAWPIGVTLLSGQAAWLIYYGGWINGIEVPETLLTFWCAASAVSLVRYRAVGNSVDFFHTGLLSVVLMGFAIAMGINGSTWMPWVGLIASACAGLMVAAVGINPLAPSHQLLASRFLGWVTIGLGLLVIDQFGSGHPWPFKWTVIVTWIAGWVVAWRLFSMDRRERWAPAAKAIADVEFSWLLLLAAAGELVFIVATRDAVADGMIDSLFWLRIAAYFCVALSTVLRSGRKLVWQGAIGMVLVVAAFLTLRVAILYEANLIQRAMLASVSAGFALAMIAHALPWIARATNVAGNLVADLVPVNVGRLVGATLQVAYGVAAITIVLSCAMIFNGVTPSVIQLTIVAVAFAAWTIAELAELSRLAPLRHQAVTLALITMGLWASVDSGETLHPVLSGSMRWLVASVFAVPMVLFVIPRLLGEKVSSRWQPALRRAAMLSGAAAVGSLLVMLSCEAVIRTPEGISGISRPMVIGVAVTLGILSAIAALIAILSGPPKGSGIFSGLDRLTDQQRRVLIIASQAIGGIAWLHVFLCKTNWAFIGLRGYWPYIVMGLAFASVGMTEWAKRRGDKVLSQTIAQTALYLPLIPVVGFWLSGSLSEFSWAFTGGKVRYDLLLALGAVYYIGLSAMWKQIMPRVAAVVLGNAALWVVLIQQPDWSFLVHPQAWLIPPAVCVLVVAHMYRDRLQPAVATGIRYASTLVIYVSSTADMLLQQIGTNISGPIILVLLAMAGMLAGVVLRVRPFLYLGATFVFIGVTSMVWHAQKSFDAVWPWWVFGITTGICLLAGLMALEKNKDKLRQYASTLATWQ